MKRYLSAFFLIFISYSMQAQTDQCAVWQEENYAQTFENSMPEFYNYLSKLGANHPQTKSANNATINSIPLNINIVRNDWGLTAMDTSLIRKGIKYMNEKFADAGFEFYVCGSYNYIDDSQYYNMGGNSYQTINPTYGVPDIINVYFVNFIVINNGSAIGVAPTPGGGDWIILRHDADTTVYAHEMGHFFGLLHTHGLLYDNFSGPYTEEYVDGSNCQETGDYFCDTPADPGLSPAIVNGANVNGLCQYVGNKKDGHNQTYQPDEGNLMSYAPHHCQDHFSPQQSAFMRWSYITRRANLGCSQLNVDFNYLHTSSCDSPFLFQFQNISAGLSNLEWDVNDDGITDYTSLNPSHNFSTPGLKYISLKGTANGKTYSRCKIIEIVAPNKVPKLENFNDALLPEAWKIINYDNARQWGRADVVGSDGLTSNAFYFDNFDYRAYEEEDIIETNAYDLRSFQNARLTFDIAYALHNKLDRFYVTISTDCGNNYSTPILFLIGEDLQTHPKQYSRFVPTENDWKSIIIPLDNYVGNIVSFQLVNYNKGGNVLYLDNVKVEGGDSGSQEIGWAKTNINTNESSIDGQSACKGYRNISVPLFISEAPLADVNVQVSASGSATEILDFDILNPNLVFPAGQDSFQQLQLRIYDDGASEGVEILNLHLNINGASSFNTTSNNERCQISIQDNDPLIAGDKVYSEILLDENFNNMSANVPPGWLSTVSDSIYSSTFWISSSYYNFWLFDPDDVQTKMSLDSTHYMLVANILNGNLQADSAYLYTPEMNVKDFDSLVLDFDHFYRTFIPYSGDVVIEAWNGLDWIDLFHHTNLEGSFGANLAPLHTTLKIVGFTNADFRIRFGIVEENIGHWYFIDNVKLKGYKTKAKVAVQLNASTDQYLGPNELVHFYDGYTGDILASIQNLSSWDYGCTTVEVDRTGAGAIPYLILDSTYYASQKTLLVSPSNNNQSGNYFMSLYFNEDEKLGWANETGNVIADMSLVKTGGPIGNISPSNTQANGPTNDEALSSFQQVYADNDIQVSGLFSTGFSGFAGVKSLNTTLPIEMYKELEGRYREGQGNVLSWITSTEVNNDHFEVQRSYDGINFTPIGKVSGAGNSSILNAYQYLDSNYKLALNYYRLKQIDFDGKFTFSNIAIVSNYTSSFNSIPIVFPNPTKDELNIKYSHKFLGILLLYNVNGQVILRKEMDSLNENIDLSLYPNGIYLLKLLREEGQVFNEKIVKL